MLGFKKQNYSPYRPQLCILLFHQCVNFFPFRLVSFASAKAEAKMFPAESMNIDRMKGKRF